MIRATYRDPFDAFSAQGKHLSGPVTVRGAALAVHVPREWWEQPLAFVNGEPCDDLDRVLGPDDWVILQPRLMGGGGGDGGKNPLAIIASFALLAVTGFVAGGGLATRFGLQAFAQGTIASRLAAAGVGLLGSRLLAGLQPAPGVQGQPQIDASRSGAASADGNVAQSNGALPRVIGTRKVFPPFVCEPFTYFDGEDEVVEAVYGLAGPHKLEQLRLGNALIEEMPGVASQVLEGWPGQPVQELVQRFAKTEQIGTELPTHALQEDGLTADLSAEGGFLPQPYLTATASDPDEFRFDVSFARGLSDGGSTILRVPLRLRMRQPGGDWINLPEVHWRGTSFQEMRGTIRLLWNATPAEVTAAPGEGWAEIRRSSPGQTVVPTSDGWTANAHFGTSGDAFLTSNNPATSGVQNVAGGRHELRIYLNGATFPKGRWEIEIVRGVTINDASYASAGYTFGGSVWDLFGVRGSGVLQVAQTQKGLNSGLFLVRASSVFYRNPVQTDQAAIVAIKARNRQLGPLSVIASGYVRDWQIGPNDFQPAAAPTLSLASGALISVPSLNTSASIFGWVDLTFPASPAGVIWETGGNVIGAYLGVTAGQLVLRMGNGGAANVAGRARLAVDVAPLAGRSGVLFWAIDPPSRSVRLWWRDGVTGGLQFLGEAVAGVSIGSWTGTDNGAVGQVGGLNVVEGETVTAWNGTIAQARFWSATQAPQALVDLHPAPEAVTTEWAVTSNPAPHLFDVLQGALNPDPVPVGIIDVGDLLEWRNRCAVEDYTVDAIVEDGTVDAALALIAGAGFGSPRKSNRWGIVQGRDYTGTAPEVIFTPRNSRGLSMDKPLADRLDGILAVFRDEARDHAERQIVEPPDAVGGLLLQVEYEAETTEAKVRRRARRELRQARLQTASYSLEAPAEAIIVRRGDLVGVEHFAFDRQTGRGRVINWTVSGGNVTSVTLDDEVEVARDVEMLSVTNLLAVPDMLAMGVQYGFAIGADTFPITNASGSHSVLTLQTAVPISGLASEPVAAVGPLGRVYERMIVAGVEPQADFTARLSLVDEIPEIWQ